jgi:hypothetical protein
MLPHTSQFRCSRLRGGSQLTGRNFSDGRRSLVFTEPLVDFRWMVGTFGVPHSAGEPPAHSSVSLLAPGHSGDLCVSSTETGKDEEQNGLSQICACCGALILTLLLCPRGCCQHDTPILFFIWSSHPFCWTVNIIGYYLV